MLKVIYWTIGPKYRISQSAAMNAGWATSNFSDQCNDFCLLTWAPKTPPNLCRVHPTKGRTNKGTIYGRTDHSNYQGTGIWWEDRWRVSAARDQFCDILQIQIEVWRNGTFWREAIARFGGWERQVEEVAGRADVGQRHVAKHQFKKMVTPVAKQNAVVYLCETHGVS